MKLVWQVAGGLCVIGAAFWWTCTGRGDGGRAPAVRSTDRGGAALITSAPRRPVSALAGVPYHGMSWQVHYSATAVEQAKVLLREIADLGADTVMISNPGYQEHAGSDSFKIDPVVTPSREQWLEIFKIAHDNGLRVILMPIILLSDPRGNEWRGVISPRPARPVSPRRRRARGASSPGPPWARRSGSGRSPAGRRPPSGWRAGRAGRWCSRTGRPGRAARPRGGAASP